MSAVGAFFDVDETLVRVNSMAEFLWYVPRHRSARSGLGALERGIGLARAAARYARLALASFSDPSRIRVNRRYYAGLRGVELAEYEALARRWFAEVAARCPPPFNAEVVARLRDHQGRGHVVALVSGSHRALVAQVAAELGVVHVIATDVEVEGGRFTGRLVAAPLVSTGKVAAMRAFAEVHGLDLGRSHAYSDHASDLPMLEAVGHPCAIVGDPRLAAVAWERRWPTIVVGAGPGSPARAAPPGDGRTEAA